MMTKAFLLLSILFFLTIAGCSGNADYPPVSSQQAAQVKSSSKLDDAVELLGDFHDPSSKQLAAMQETIERMPESIRKNAEADRKVAWGDDSNFLVVVVNDEGTIWATANRHTGSP